MIYTIQNIVDGKTIEDKEKTLLATCEPLRLQDGYDHQPIPLKNFINNFLLTHRNHFQTRRVKDSKITCELGRLRSMIDIFLISRFYYPDCSLREVMDIVSQLPNLATQVCHTVQRRVFWVNHGLSIIHADVPDEFGLLFEYKGIKEPVTL